MILAAALLACTHSAATVVLDVGGHAVTAEVVADPEARAEGLMHRTSLADDAGMLFVYAQEAPRSFWMKNVPIPLSIAYLDRRGKIVKIAEMQPHDQAQTQSLYPAMYALEMNGGWFARNGVETGAVVAGIPTDVDPK